MDTELQNMMHLKKIQSKEKNCMTKDLIKLKEKFAELPLPVKTSMVYVIFSVLQKGISFFVVPIYTRLVSAEQYGVYSTFLSWDSIICIFSTLNMWNYQFNNGMTKYENNRDGFTSALTGLSWAVTGGVFTVLWIIKDWFLKFSGLSIELLIIMFIGLLLRPAYEYWCSRQRFEYDIRKYIFSALAIAVATPIISIIFITLYKKMCWSNTGTALVLGKSLSAGVVYFIVVLLIVRKNNKVYDKAIWRYAISYSLPLVPHFLSTVLLGQCDRIMISKMCGYDETAIYSVAYSVGAVMIIFNAAIMDSIIPWTYQKLKVQNYDKMPLVSSVSLIIIAGINLLVSLCAPEIVSFMAPEEYKIAMYVIPPVAISNVFIFLYNLYANIEYFYEETKMVAKASIISAVANVILNYIFIKKFGFLAAGYTTVACYMIYALCHFMFSKKILKKNGVTNSVYNNSLLWAIAGGSLTLSILVTQLYQYLWLRILIIVFSFVLVIAFRKRLIALFLRVKTEKNM